MARPDYDNCAVCGDTMILCIIDDCDECWTGEHDNGMCSCCYEYICPRHTATVTCPHSAADHDVTLATATAEPG